MASPSARVYRILANYRNQHPHILTSAFADVTVEEGRVDEGAVMYFSIKAKGRTQHCHQRIEEPEPGRFLQKSEIGRDPVTAFTLDPSGTGSRVRVATSWLTTGVIRPAG